MASSPIDETYEDVRALGVATARRYSHSGLSTSEALCIFDDAFLAAYNGGWKPEARCSFSSWIRTKTYYRILDCRKAAKKQIGRLGDNSELDGVIDHRWEEDHTTPVEESERHDIYRAIPSGDARRILEHIAANRERYQDQVQTVMGTRQARRDIRNYLKSTYGWNQRRVAMAMSQVRLNLN